MAHHYKIWVKLIYLNHEVKYLTSDFCIREYALYTVPNMQPKPTIPSNGQSYIQYILIISLSQHLDKLLIISFCTKFYYMSKTDSFAVGIHF